MITYVSKENNLGPGYKIRYILGLNGRIFSSSGRSPGRAIVLPPALALALAKSLTLKFFM